MLRQETLPRTSRIALLWIVAVCFVHGCANMLDYDAISFEESSEEEGSTPYNGVYASYECGTMPVPSVECAHCINAACCSEAQVCGESADCGQLAICRMGCAPDDVSCLHDCGIDHFDGIMDWKVLNTCAGTQCAGECALTSGDG